MKKAGLFVCVVLLSCVSALAQPKSLDDAVIALRNIKQEGLSETQMEAKAKEIDESWKFLIAAGAKGSERLKQEIEKVNAGKEKDDVFKLNATVVLWNIGRTDDAEYIAKIWSTTPLTAQYNYVFYTAFEAARTQDPKVLPMLRAVLSDDKGSMYVGAHAMNVTFPLSHEFIWGVYGPGALPILLDILEKSTEEIEIRSAIYQLAKAQYLSALPRIRQLASDPRDEVRRNAIRRLGVFGHPSDYERLIAGLNSKDPQELFSYSFALYEFEDERAVTHLIPLLQINNDRLRVETSLALLRLLTPEAWIAVKETALNEKNPQVKAYFNRSITLSQDKLPNNFAQLSLEQQRLALAKVRDADLVADPKRSAITNQELIAALSTWKEIGRTYDSGVDWMGEGHAIAAAKPENIDLILQTKAMLYGRFSDECLYEVRDLDKVVKHVGRSRYRKGLGVVAKAELK